MVVQYFDTIVYRGDDTVDSDMCKIHTQLHNAQIYKFLGNTMQYNTAMGERGLKVWAKKVSKTAPKQGRDKFTFTTSARVGERMLLNAIADLLASQQQQQEDDNKMPLASSSKRKVPHFKCQRVGTSNILRSIDQKRKEQLPDREMGAIQSQILEGIHNLEKDKQSFFDLWCEAKLPNGQHIHCWPQYRGCKGPRYDWVMISFESEEGKEIAYPGNVLVLYEDRDGHLKVLVHSVEYKSKRVVEGPHGKRMITKCHLRPAPREKSLISNARESGHQTS
jgi:hypothetical protein